MDIINEQEIAMASLKIAKFMGATIYPQIDSSLEYTIVEYTSGPEFEWAKGYYRNFKINKSQCKAKDLRYNISLEWLIPAMIKAANHVFEDGDTAYLQTFGRKNLEGEYMVRLNRFSLHTHPTLIEAAYWAVAEFVEWHEKWEYNNTPK